MKIYKTLAREITMHDILTYVCMHVWVKLSYQYVHWQGYVTSNVKAHVKQCRTTIQQKQKQLTHGSFNLHSYVRTYVCICIYVYVCMYTSTTYKSSTIKSTCTPNNAWVLHMLLIPMATRVACLHSMLYKTFMRPTHFLTLWWHALHLPLFWTPHLAPTPST